MSGFRLSSGSQKLLALLVVLVAAYLVLSPSLLSQSIVQPMSIVQGGTTLSLTQVAISGFSDYFGNAQVWLANIVVKGSGEDLIGGTISKSELTASGTTFDRDLGITYQLTKVDCYYPIQQTSNTLVTYSPQPVSQIVTQGLTGANYYNGGACSLIAVNELSSYFDNCYGQNGAVIHCGLSSASYLCYKAVPSTVGWLKILQTPSPLFNVDVKVLSGGVQETVSLSNSQATGKSSDVVGELVGTLGSLSQGCPMTSNVRFVALAGSGGDKLIGTTVSVPSTPSGLDHAEYSTLTDLQNKINSYNTEINRLINPSINAPEAIFSSSKTTKNAWSVTVNTLESPAYYPEIRLLIKAVWMGIHLQETRFIIDSVTDVKVAQGAQNYHSIVVRNDGDTGSATVTDSCAQNSPQSAYLAKGASTTLSFLTNAGSTGVSQCSVSASNSLGVTSTKTYSRETTAACTLQCAAPQKLVFDQTGACTACVCDPSVFTPQAGYHVDTYLCALVKDEVPPQTCPNVAEKSVCLSDVNCNWYDVPSCKSECKSNFVRDAITNKCVSVPCPEGQARNANGNCEAKQVGGGFPDWLLGAIVVAAVLGVLYFLLAGGKKGGRGGGMPNLGFLKPLIVPALLGGLAFYVFSTYQLNILGFNLGSPTAGLASIIAFIVFIATYLFKPETVTNIVLRR